MFRSRTLPTGARSAIPGIAALALVAVAGCARRGATSSSVFEMGPPEVVISTESAIIGTVEDVHVAPDGTVLLSDRQSHSIHRVAPDGSYLGAIGREGEGPGEFRLPRDLAVTGDTIWVVEEWNGRIQGVTADGESLSTRMYPRAALNYPPELFSDGTLLQPTLGYDTALVRLHDRTGDTLTTLGSPHGVPVLPVSFRTIQQKAARGELAPIYANIVAPVFDESDSTVWVAERGTGWVRRFDFGGAPVDSLLLQEPEFPAIWDAFVAGNAVEEPTRVRLNYLDHAEVVGGNLWVLIGRLDGQPARIRVVTSDGRLGHRLEFPGVVEANMFDVDLRHGWIYFYTPDEAQLVRVELPPSLVGGGDATRQVAGDS